MSHDYAQLVHLLEVEADLLRDGRFEEVPAVQAEREALIEELPATPPAAARPLLERARDLLRDNTTRITIARTEIASGLAHLGRGRRAVAAYAGGSETRLEARG
ncbi:MAG TPA: hypothetical protein VGF23_27005 [Gaiellaceae bacterium]